MKNSNFRLAVENWTKEHGLESTFSDDVTLSHLLFLRLFAQPLSDVYSILTCYSDKLFFSNSSSSDVKSEINSLIFSLGETSSDSIWLSLLRIIGSLIVCISILVCSINVGEIVGWLRIFMILFNSIFFFSLFYLVLFV